MDYDKLTKAELIEKLENLSHLATTVREKDSELSRLKQQVEKMEKQKEHIENAQLQEALKVNKELVDENREVFEDMRYLIQVYNTFLNNFQNNSQLVQILLKKYLNGGQ